jgi:hypothetical protein
LSPIAWCGVCRGCGTPLTFESADDAAITLSLTIDSFDDPYRFRPDHHFAIESRHEAWVDTRALTATRSERNPTSRDRWIKTFGKLPD